MKDSLPELLRWLDLAGVFANAVLGGALARRYRFDPIGFAVLATASGLGGGIIRDVLLQRGTPIALRDDAYLLTALVGAAFAFLVASEGQAWHKIFPFVDAFALGCWAAVGTQKALHFGLDWLPALFLGTVTAVGGGIVRDLCVGRIPTVFGRNTLYATCALVASAVMVMMQRTGLTSAGVLTATVVGALLCLMARWRGWMLPEGMDLVSRVRLKPTDRDD